ncbi:hypothetical protein AC579_2870 [Pseudocercospora musae]|uniref:Uncharacterized protein n=1 Tax=Pseudocercospora musae TaxID=113226 RepID=A0A139IU14_9PEZI|nr:hypothetical protein AC579_2870 [Pseudocercospora musae]
MGDNSLTSSPGGGDEKSSKEIRFEGGAPGPRWRKLPSWLPLIPLGLCTSFGVSGYSPATMQIEKHYGVSQEIGVLKRRLQEDGGNIPEARLRMSKIAAIVHPISLFWFSTCTGYCTFGMLILYLDSDDLSVYGRCLQAILGICSCWTWSYLEFGWSWPSIFWLSNVRERRILTGRAETSVPGVSDGADSIRAR